MPFGGKPLPDDQIELFRRWIREGAKNDSTSDAPETESPPLRSSITRRP